MRETLTTCYGGSSCQDTVLANYPSIAYPIYPEIVDTVVLSLGRVRPPLTPDMHGLPPHGMTVIDWHMVRTDHGVAVGHACGPPEASGPLGRGAT